MKLMKKFWTDMRKELASIRSGYRPELHYLRGSRQQDPVSGQEVDPKRQVGRPGGPRASTDDAV